MLRVQELRRKRELTREALAFKAGVSVSTVVRAERDGKISLRNLQKLAKALGVKPGSLFKEEVA